MTTLNYKFVSVCSGGDHVTLDVSLNGGATKRFTYSVDEDIRPSLASLTSDEQAFIALWILKLKASGFTRQQILNAVQAPSGVTVTI